MVEKSRRHSTLLWRCREPKDELKKNVAWHFFTFQFQAKRKIFALSLCEEYSGKIILFNIQIFFY